MEAKIIEQYASVGALGVSFIVLMIIIIYMVKSLKPTLDSLIESVSSLKIENQNYKSAMDNNTKALEAVAKSVDEVAKSNQVIADMVRTFSNALDNQTKTIDRHDVASGQKFEEAKDAVKDLRTDFKESEKRGERLETGLGKLKGVIEMQTELIKVK